NHCLGARLLQHDFRNPNAVGIAGPAPGEIAMAAAVPREQRLHSRTRSHSATTAKSSGPTSQASYSGFNGSSRIRSWRHSSPLYVFLAGVLFDGEAGGFVGHTKTLDE